MTLLTVGLPVYNAMPFLPQTVDSLLRQSYRISNCWPSMMALPMAVWNT